MIWALFFSIYDDHKQASSNQWEVIKSKKSDQAFERRRAQNEKRRLNNQLYSKKSNHDFEKE
jgi:hypothetical protein